MEYDDPATWSTDAYEVAAELDAEPGGDGTGREFPDLFAKLHPRRGYDQASRLWSQACAVYDAKYEAGDQAEAQEAEPERERRRADVGASDAAEVMVARRLCICWPPPIGEGRGSSSMGGILAGAAYCLLLA